MLKSFWNVLAAGTVGLLFAASGLVPGAQDEIADAPLVAGLQDLRGLSDQLVALSENSTAATVSLVSQGAGGAGSGVVVSEDGLILTAAHVMSALGEEVIVLFPDGSRKSAKKLGGDFDRDAAMVQITDEGTFPHVEVGQSKDLLRNEWCVALGHPGGYDPARSPPVRLGRVLNNGMFITTDCAVVGGDSGGPLFDVDGKVIGIHSNIGASLTENRHVPISVFLDQWEDMKSGKRTGRRFAARGRGYDPNRPVLGINLGPAGEEGGVRVEGIMKGSPAEEVGLQEGDVVMKIDGEGVRGAEELIREVGKFEAGEELQVTYRRDGKEEEVTLKLARLGDLIEEEESPPSPREDPEGGDDEERADELDKEEVPSELDAEETARAVQELLEEAMRRGELELDPKELEEMGGMEGLRKMVEELARSLGPDALRDMLEGGWGEPDHFFESSMKALEPTTKEAADSVVAIEVDDEQVALGTVVSAHGHILTKDTETREGKVSWRRGEELVELQLVKRYPQRDLALFQGNSEGLRPVRWVEDERQLPLGMLVTAPGSEGEPLGIGLVSVRTRALGNVGFLGIQPGEAREGVTVVRTVEDGPAAEAGLRAGDVITHIDGTTFDGPLEFGNTIRTYRGGDTVEFRYQRDGEEKTVKVELAARDETQTSRRFRRMNEMSGPLSARLSGFPEALQHDIPLSPFNCGGPLLDLDGRCVGINVSRAGRVKTLAIPVGDLRALLEDVSLEPAPERQAAAPRERRRAANRAWRNRVLTQLQDLEERLGGIEERLETLEAN